MPENMAKKIFRQYIPRTYEILAENDAIVIDNPDVTIFEHKYLVWLRDAVLKDGSGLVMIGGNAGFGGRPNPPWGSTVIQDILPVWCITGGWLEYGRVEILRRDHEFLSTLPLDRRWEWMAAVGGNEVKMKQEAVLLAEYKGLTTPWKNPFWVTWNVGKGRCFAMTCDWSPLGGIIFMKWPYYGDFAVNLMMYLSRNPIPDDLETLHKARRMYLEYRSTRGYLISLMEFAEKVGANMAPVNKIIGEADKKHRQSADEYIQFEFHKALEFLESSIDDLRTAGGKAIELKDRAMFWIYLIEWSVVTATFAMVGFILWTIMIKRRLYHEVRQTRFV